MSKTLSKALYLLTLFNEDEPFLTTEDLSKMTNVPKPTVYRLLKTLVDFNFVQKVGLYQGKARIESDYYQLGIKCLEIGAIAASQLEIRKIALPYMKQLRDMLQESVQLIIRDQSEVVYIEKVESIKNVRLYTKIGRRAPLYAGACPRAILSFMDDDEIRDVLKKPLVSVGPNSCTDRKAIWDLILQARTEGYTFSDSELEGGSAAFATPIFDRFGNIAGSLSIAGFSDVFKAIDDMTYIIPMWEASAKISEGLGMKKLYPYKMIEGDAK